YGPLGYFVVRADHPFHPGLNTEWHLGDSRDWMQHIATQRTLKSVASVEPAVSHHANGEIVANSVGLRTVRNNRVEGLVEHVRQEARFGLPTFQPMADGCGLINHHQYGSWR